MITFFHWSLVLWAMQCIEHFSVANEFSSALLVGTSMLVHCTFVWEMALCNCWDGRYPLPIYQMTGNRLQRRLASNRLIMIKCRCNWVRVGILILSAYCLCLGVFVCLSVCLSVFVCVCMCVWMVCVSLRVCLCSKGSSLGSKGVMGVPTDTTAPASQALICKEKHFLSATIR